MLNPEPLAQDSLPQTPKSKNRLKAKHQKGSGSQVAPQRGFRVQGSRKRFPWYCSVLNGNLRTQVRRTQNTTVPLGTVESLAHETRPLPRSQNQGAHNYPRTTLKEPGKALKSRDERFYHAGLLSYPPAPLAAWPVTTR